MGTKKNKKKKNKNKNKNKYSNNDTNNTGRRKKLKQIAAENFGKFCEQLNKIGLRIKEMGGDGNCLFRSFSDQLEGNENNYKFFRTETIKHMVENRDNFEPFIEDDQKFDAYIEEMSRDGKWGGNLEIQALSIRFNVNFYIHIYNHPMYIVRNFDTPMRNVHLSYHDGSHYNSVRLIEDVADDIPQVITEDILKGVQQTSDMTTLLKIEEQTNEQLDNEEETKSDGSGSDYEEEYKKYQKDNNEEKQKQNQLTFKGVAIKDNDEKQKKRKYLPKVLTSSGQFLIEPDDNKKCHCLSNKKYKNCCKSEDIHGDYDDNTEEFFCDIEKFVLFSSMLQINNEDKDRYSKNKKQEEVNEKIEKSSEDVGTIEKKLGTIYI